MPHRASGSWSVASSVPSSPASFVVGGVCRLVTIRLASVRTTRKYSDIATAMNGESDARRRVSLDRSGAAFSGGGVESLSSVTVAPPGGEAGDSRGCPSPLRQTWLEIRD